ncbi:MAG: hypothetical protein HEP70_09500 [Rhodobiaceae bacterium]|nr:hypothetical protein [Rhodobiaceae bacterium]
MFGWLKKKVLEASADAMKNDIERFIVSLRGADDEEISLMVVLANIIRLNLIEMGKIPLAALDLGISRDESVAYQCDMCSVTLVNTIKQFQKMNQPSDAVGAMILLHSVRALNVPEIRIFGREMWQELERGFPYVDDTLEDIRGLTGNPLPANIDDELRFIPHGLEPGQ